MRQILHLSDIHFGPPHRPEVSEAVLDLVDRRRPDLVIVSGDLTQRAKPYQFQEARAFVDRLAAPSLTVPGNHDVPMYRFWERLLDPYGAYRRHFAEDLEPAFQDDALTVAGINTAHGWTVKEGRITHDSLAKVRRVLESAPEDHFRIVVAHHQLAPAPRFDNQRVTRNSRAAIALFSELGVDLVLSGHLHQAFLFPARIYYPAAAENLRLLHSGTSTSSRGRGGERGLCTCNWIRLAPRRLSVTRLGWDDTAGRFGVWSRQSFPRSPKALLFH